MAYKSELKKVDEAFAYNSSVNFLTVHMAQALVDMNSELAKIDELLVDGGIETIYHTDHEPDIEYSAEMFGELLAYSSDLAFYALEYIDNPLYKNFNLNATESISRIKVDDYTTANTLGIQIAYVHADESEDLDTPQTLCLQDFLGITSPENGGRLRNVPKEFSDFTNQYVTVYENMKANLIDEDGKQLTLNEYLNQLDTMGEFSHTMDQPFKQFLSAVLDLTIILPIIEACTGTDYITGEDLSDFDRGMKAVGAVVQIFTLGQSGILAMPAKEALMSLGKLAVIDVASTGASYWTGYACNELGLPLPLTLMLSMGMGMGTSYGLSRVMFDSSVPVEINKNKESSDVVNSLTGNEVEIPTAFKQEKFNSTYEERIAQTPSVNNKVVEFKEVDLRGESKCTLKPPPDAELQQILADAGVDGIEYKNGVPDFSPVSKIELDDIDMTNGRTGKNGTYAQANNMLAEKLNASKELAEELGITPKNGSNYTASDVARYMAKNKLTWHELNDMTTVQMVPTKVNSTFGHLGGISEASR